jgi:uncharacterized protein
MTFEFDPDKSAANREKHGIDFVQAQAIWEDTDYIEILLKTADEARFMVIGKIDENVWSGNITYRGESVRIITVRRSRKEEIAVYES